MAYDRNSLLERVARLIEPEAHASYDADYEASKGVTYTKMALMPKISSSRERAEAVIALVRATDKEDKKMPVDQEASVPLLDKLDQAADKSFKTFIGTLSEVSKARLLSLLIEDIEKPVEPSEVVKRAWPRNPFKKEILKRQFAACIYCYFARDKDFFRADGSRHTGNGVANQFWWGYDGARKPEQWDAASKDTPAYASYRAGSLVAAYEASLSEGGIQNG